MFGLSFGELVVLLLVAVVVLGPKELPRYLRKAGMFAGQLRRMAYDMRAKSGIDEVLRSEGIGEDIAEIRRLATFARGELGGIMTAVRSTANGARLDDVLGSPYSRPLAGEPQPGAAPAGAPPAGAAPGSNGALGAGATAAAAAALAAGTAATVVPASAAPAPPAAGLAVPRPMAPAPVPWQGALTPIDRAREYPKDGPDAYAALPEDANVYGGDLPQSDLAADPVYARGADAGDDSAPAGAPT